MRNVFILMLLSVPAFGQYLNIQNASCDCPLSRGSQGVIVGNWGVSAVAADAANLPREMAGFTIDISGVKQGIYSITPDRITFAVSTAIPVIPSRPKPKPYLLTLTAPAGKATWYFWMADSAPHVFEPIKGTFAYPGDPNIYPIVNGEIKVSSFTPTAIFLEVTGALSFRPEAEYFVFVGDVEYPAQVIADVLDEGRQILSFAVPPALSSVGDVWLTLRTPSAFSRGVIVRFLGR